MLRICALNESGSDTDSEGELSENRAETREVQEEHLLSLYNTGLKYLVSNDKTRAKNNFLEITNNEFFLSENGCSEQIQKSLRYNVHKNLAECYLGEGELDLAKDQLLNAIEIDDSDVSLWFKIAATAVKLNNLYLCRTALEEGLRCSPNHWPCLENLITVTFKLFDFVGCLGYCALALKRDPLNEKAILFKSKVYNEMPFLQDAYNDKDFVVVKTERETFSYLPPKPPKKERVFTKLQSLTWVGLSQCILDLYQTYFDTEFLTNPVDTVRMIQDLKNRVEEEEEAVIKVSVQNLVEYMIDIVEDKEAVDSHTEEVVEFVLEDLLQGVCSALEEEERPESEKISREIIKELINGLNYDARKKKSVILAAPAKEKKKHFSIFDEIPEELIEKRRSSRVSRVSKFESQPSSDTSNDFVQIFTPKELLESFLPKTLKLGRDKSPKQKLPPKTPEEKLKSAKKELFPQIKKDSGLSKAVEWVGEEEEARQVEHFMNIHQGKSTLDLMRFYMEYLFGVNPNMPWPKELGPLYGQIYKIWRFHLQNEPLDPDPEDVLTKELLRYTILGNECLLSKYLVASKERENASIDDEMNEDSEVFEEDIPEDERNEIRKDLDQLTCLIHIGLPIDLEIRILSAKFHFYSLTQQEGEAAIESHYLEQLYKKHPNVVVNHPVQDYTVATKQYLETYLSDLTKNKELEELYKYFDDKRYSDIVKLLLETLDKPGLITPKDKEGGKAPNREGQIDILIESLYNIGDYEQCLKWTESALNTQFKSVTHDPETNETVAPSKSDWDVLDAYLSTIDSCLQGLDLTSELPEKRSENFGGISVANGARLAANLVKILVLQIDDTSPAAELSYPSALPWILLHKLIAWQEKYVTNTKEKLNNSNEDEEDGLVDLDAPMKGSLSLLCSAHDYLGQKSACSLQKGRLLNYIVDIFVPILTASDLPGYSDQLKTNLEQAIYCLYAHPSKKVRVKHLADHNVSQIGLSWERSLVLYNYVRPRKIPEHDDVKIMSITADTENLLKRIVALIPDSVNVEKRRAAGADFIQGKTNRIKGLSDLDALPYEAQDLFYLLADYYFKNSDFEAAIKNYTIDLTFNKNRFDTWAALALSQASLMDTKLNSCKQIVPGQMLEEIASVELCFKECLKIDGSNYNLWIEFGNFSYYIHSYISRTIKNESENLNMDLFEKLETKKEYYLKLTESNYTKTLDIIERDGISANDVDERWLIHFMKGKIKEKSNVPFLECLESYKVSMDFLRKNKVVVPKRISYSNPQHFALEAMEVYYRIHASILKYLLKFEKNNKEVEEEVQEKLFYFMKEVQLDPIYNTFSTAKKEDRFIGKRKRGAGDSDIEGAPAAKVARDDETSTNIMRDVLEVVDTMIEDIEEINDKSKYKTSNLASIAIKGLEDVVLHFSHHFKALYRMAHYYSTSKAEKSLAMVKQHLLNESIAKSFLGLFGERKINNIFNGVWRIPITEIDRPGSFATHCARALTLLLDTLRDTNELNFLMEIAVQLRKPPSEENKFLHESDRQEVVTQANTYLLTATKNVIKSANIESERVKPTVLLDIHKVYIKLQRLWPGKEKELTVPIKDFYAQIKEKDRDKVSIEEVLRFCVSETTRQRVMLNPKTTAGLVNTATTSSNMTAGVRQTNQAATAARIQQQQKEQQQQQQQQQHQQQQQQSNSALLQQYSQLSQILADQQAMMQYQQLIAMSSALPGMSTTDIAAMCGLNLSSGIGGLSASDLSAYTAQLSNMSSSQLAQLGLTSAHLNQLAQLAAITAGSTQQKYEQEYLRQVMSGSTSKPTATATTTSAMGSAVKMGQSSSPAASKLAGGPSKMTVPVKQTAKFKAKPQSVPVMKKAVQKTVANLAGTSGANPTKLGMNTNLTSVAQKLNSSGVTLTQPKPTIPKPNQGKPPPQPTVGKPRMSIPASSPGAKPLTTQQMLQAIKNASNKPGQAQSASKPAQAQATAKPPQAHSASKLPQTHTGNKPAQAQSGIKPPQAHASQPARLSQKFPHLSITNIELFKASGASTSSSQNSIPMAGSKPSGASNLPRQGAIPKPQNQTIPKPQTLKGAKLTALQAKQAALKKTVAAQNNSQPGSSASSPTASLKATKASDAKSQLAMFKQNVMKQLGVKSAKQAKSPAGVPAKTAAGPVVKPGPGGMVKSGAGPSPKPGASGIPKPGASGIPKPGASAIPKPGAGALNKAPPKKQQVKPKPKPSGGGDAEIICIDID